MDEDELQLLSDYESGKLRSVATRSEIARIEAAARTTHIDRHVPPGDHMNPTAAPLERLHYFAGRLLSADDLQAEQDYFVNRLRRHNRFQHGWGVVSGLEVHIDTGAEIVVTPGFAVDCAGNEIVLEAAARLPMPGDAELLFVVLRYAETPVAPLPTPTPADIGIAFGRIREGLQIEIVAADPSAGHSGQGVGTPGCGTAHGLCIARLRRSPRGWKLALKGRR